MPYGGTPMKRGRGRPPKAQPAEHTIYSDGTYSNDSNTVAPKVEPPKEEQVSKTLKEYDVILFNDNRKWMVLQLLDWGLAVASWPRKTMPSMADTVQFSWEQLEDMKIRKL